jgi:small subunit ribosomal protein S16
MAVVMRMTKIGKSANKDFHFRIIVIDSHKARDARFIEELGYYNPAKKPPLLKINMERFEHWRKLGARPSDTLASLVKKVKKENK